jgi:hypothetical protein
MVTTILPPTGTPLIVVNEAVKMVLPESYPLALTEVGVKEGDKIAPAFN